VFAINVELGASTTATYIPFFYKQEAPTLLIEVANFILVG
jgi:cadmium resistance protein CadD (predicted permease)